MKGRVIRIYGVVQGVGFRPFVARTATALDLTGSVANKGSYVEVLLSGSEEALASFRRKLETDPPVRSAILRIDEQDGEVPETAEFRIVESEKDPGNVFVSPDIATCDQCRKELFDPADRRYGRHGNALKESCQSVCTSSSVYAGRSVSLRRSR